VNNRPSPPGVDDTSADVMRMKRAQRSKLIAVLAVLVVLAAIASAVLVLSRLNPDKGPSAGAASATASDAPSQGSAPRFVTPPPVLIPGIVTVRGDVMLAKGHRALLLSNADGHLYTADIDVTTAPLTFAIRGLDVGLRASSAHLVNGKSEILVAGVTKMGATQAETEYGVFKPDGTQVGKKIDGVDLASDRPVLALPVGAWVDTKVGEKHLLLVQNERHELTLSAGDEAPKVLFAAPDRDGPAMGSPIITQGDAGAVLLFQDASGWWGFTIDKGLEPKLLDPSVVR